MSKRQHVGPLPRPRQAALSAFCRLAQPLPAQKHAWQRWQRIGCSSAGRHSLRKVWRHHPRQQNVGGARWSCASLAGNKPGAKPALTAGMGCVLSTPASEPGRHFGSERSGIVPRLRAIGYAILRTGCRLRAPLGRSVRLRRLGAGFNGRRGLLCHGR
jgi:hypothetical protein